VPLPLPPPQEVMDLFMLSGARTVLSTSGSYANMARVFTSFSTASTPLHHLAVNNEAPTYVYRPVRSCPYKIY
jgi:hypothetical protein